MKMLAIIGASGHGKVVADIAAGNGYEKIVFLDDKDGLAECGGYPVVGRSTDALDMDTDVFVGIGKAETRRRLQESLPAARIVTLVHPKAVIAGDVRLGRGTVVMAGAVINPGTVIGEGCVINTCASVDHDCRVGNYVHVSVGSRLCGSVVVGDETWIGAGAVVNNNIHIQQKCMIGSGAIVVSNLEYSGIYVGCPAQKKSDDPHRK